MGVVYEKKVLKTKSTSLECYLWRFRDLAHVAITHNNDKKSYGDLPEFLLLDRWAIDWSMLIDVWSRLDGADHV